MRNIHDTLHEYKKLVWLIVLVLLGILILNFFFYWEPYDSDAQQSKSIPFTPSTQTYKTPGNLSVQNTL